MDQRTAQIAPDARQMTQVLRLAVAPVEAGENAEDLGGTLRAERHIELHEGTGVETLVGVEPRLHVAAEQRDLGLVRYVDACVLQQRDKVVGCWPEHRVLEIQNADPRD